MSTINQNQINRLFKLADLINAIQSKKKDGYKKVLNSLYDEYKVQAQGIKGSVKIPTFNTGHKKAKRNATTKKDVLFNRLRKWKNTLKPADREPFDTPGGLINRLIAGGDGLDSAYERYEEETFGRSEKKSKPKLKKPKLKKPKTPANQSEILDPPDVKKSGGIAVVKKSGGTAVVNNGGGADAKSRGAPPVRPPPTAAQARNQMIIESEIKAEQKDKTTFRLDRAANIREAQEKAEIDKISSIRSNAEGGIIGETDIIPTRPLAPKFGLETSEEWIDQFELQSQDIVDTTNVLIKYGEYELPLDMTIDVPAKSNSFSAAQANSISKRINESLEKEVKFFRPINDELKWQVASGFQSFDEGKWHSVFPTAKSTLNEAEIMKLLGSENTLDSEGFPSVFKRELFIY